MGNSGIDAYRRQQLEAMRPEQLVLVCLDRGLAACRRRERRQAQRAIDALIQGLDFEQPLAGRLLVLYDWALRLVREGRFAEASEVLGPLRETWAAACDASPPAGRSAPAKPGAPAGIDIPA